LKGDARAFLDNMRDQIRKGTYVRPSERRDAKTRAATVAGLADKWLSVYVKVSWNEKGQRQTKYRVENYVKPFMGDVPAASVTKDTLREYRAYLEALKDDAEKEEDRKPRLSVQTVAHILSEARCLFSWAHDMGHISTLPIPRKLLPKVGETEPRGLSHDEQAKISALEGPLGLACRIMLGTGARWSELCRLTSADLKDGEMVIQGMTKTKKLRRVPVPPALLKELKTHVGKLVPYGDTKDNPAFCRSVQRKSGVSDFSAHRCRHSFALNYLEKGGNIRVLQALMGHASLETTEIYLKIGQKVVREDARKVMGWSATA
jgi:integrase/recombinase XerD